VQRAQVAKQRAEEALKTGKTEADFTHAEDSLKRAETRLEVAKKSG
jgi:F0F1-type ATP synthase epsilon subunit